MDFKLEPGRIFTMGELGEVYPGQWLAVEVIERDDAGQPVRVTVLKRGVNAMTVREDVGKSYFCTLYTGPIPEIAHRGMF
jgi:hypothetical protein